jgi:hypothetical protein
MRAYRVHIEIGFTTVEISEPHFKMSVTKGAKAAPGAGTALMEAVLYREEGLFVEHCRYLFEAVGQDNRPVSLVSSLDDFRTAIGSFSVGTGYRILLVAVPEDPACTDKNTSRYRPPQVAVKPAVVFNSWFIPYSGLFSKKRVLILNN